jgi:hypothetical protein
MNEQRGVSETVGAILVFAVVVLCLSIYYSTHLSQELKRNELRHREKVEGSFLHLKEAVEGLENGEVSITISMAPELVSGFLHSPAPRPGRLKVENRGQGSIQYLSNYTSIPNFSILFEGGAVILVQGDAVSFLSPPSLLRVEDNVVYTREYRLRGEANLSASGEICIRVRSIVTLEENEKVTYTLAPRPETRFLWQRYLQEEGERIGASLENDEVLILSSENSWKRTIVELEVSLGI